MAYTTVYLNGHQDNMVRRFVVDTVADIGSIDTSQLKPGSTVFVIEDSANYMLNNKYQWRQIKNSGGGGGGDIDHIIYDGSDEDNPGNVDYDGGEEG